MRIAIVEDEESATQELRVLFARYGKENNMEFSLDTFPDALKFLASYRADYDLVMLDIEMPFMNGMEGAEKLRKLDPYVPIVFVTNMRRYAVAGYKVNAIDFIMWFFALLAYLRRHFFCRCFLRAKLSAPSVLRQTSLRFLL